MGGAIAQALLSKKNSVQLSTPHKPSFKISWVANNTQVVNRADFIIIAVKPGVVARVLQEITPYLTPSQIVISVAAGISLNKLQKYLSGHKKIVRTLPNLPAQVFQGFTLWKASPGISSAAKKTMTNLLSAFGESIEVKNEDLIDSGCAVSGCGPAFCAAFLDTLATFAQKSGFSKSQAREMSLQTLLGTALYIQQTGVEFGVLAKAVQTKGGVTEAAFKILNKKGWQKILSSALDSAYKHSKRIGKT